jgi:hypothetical protein
VYLVKLTGSTYEVAKTSITDEKGQWFINNVPPWNRYILLGFEPKTSLHIYDSRLIKQVESGQSVDFGDRTVKTCEEQ